MGDQSEGCRPEGPSSGQSGRVSILPPLVTPGTNRGTATSFARQPSMNRATPRSARALSRKLQQVFKKQRFNIEEPMGSNSLSEKFEARNWRQATEREMRKMSLIERSRYLAYEPEPKEVLDRRVETLKRVRLVLAAEKEEKKEPSLDDIIDNEWDRGLVGHLKAAEARYRLRTMKMAYERNKVDEITHLISSQQSSLEAVRLKCLLQPSLRATKPREFLSKHERERCEKLLEDVKGLTTNRDRRSERSLKNH